MTTDNDNDDLGGAAFALARVTIDAMVVIGFADGRFDRSQALDALGEEIELVADNDFSLDATVIELKSPSDLVLEGGWDGDTLIYGDLDDDVTVARVREALKTRAREAAHAARQQPLPLLPGAEGGGDGVDR